MRLEQLEYLAAVVQHGSLRRASEHLHISQPALSEGVGKLERELGVTRTVGVGTVSTGASSVVAPAVLAYREQLPPRSGS